MTTAILIVCLYIFVMACFTGIELIGKVPTTLHTPLMSGSNAISGITIVGALVALSGSDHLYAKIILVLGLTMATINVFGGYAVTDRMLKMFKKGG
jgi:NAD(P) transhydrogenase subunit alpha